MAISLSNDGWRMMITQDDSDFMRDQLILLVMQKVEGGFLPVKISIEKGELLQWDVLADTPDLPKSAIPMELCEILLSSLARYMLGVPDGDMVNTIHQLRMELHRSNRRLDDLIAGIGQLGRGHVSTGE